MGVFVKILWKQSRKGPTDKKDGGLFSTHTQTNDESQKSQRGEVEEGEGRRIKRSEEREGNDRESWQGLGERSKRRLSETNHQDQTPVGLIFFPFLRNIRARCEAKSPEIFYICAQVDACSPTRTPSQPCLVSTRSCPSRDIPADFEFQLPLGPCRTLSARISHACYRYCSHLGPESDPLQPALAISLSLTRPRGRLQFWGE